MNNKLETDCLELKQSAESHSEWLHKWLLKHPNVGKESALTNRAVIIAALIIGVSIIIAAFICRQSGSARFKNIGNYRVLDTQTGKVHEIE